MKAAGPDPAGGGREPPDLAAAAAPHIVRAMSVVGDRWTLAIMCQVFLGARRFSDLHRNLGIARAVLSTRLDAAITNGLLERREPGSGDGARIFLTEKGRGLWLVCSAIMVWGESFLAETGDGPLVLTHEECGGPTEMALVCQTCGQTVRDPGELVPMVG